MAASSIIKPAVAYYRMSTADQDESIDVQRELVAKYAAQHGYQLAGEFLDEAISGTEQSRPGFRSLLAAAERGDFRYIVVRNQARFARFKPGKLARYLDELSDADVRVVTTDKGELDPDDLVHYITTGVDSHGDNKHALDTSKTTIEKQELDVRAGWSPGRPAPFGYDFQYYDETGTPQKVVRDGKDLRDGLPFRKPKGWNSKLTPGEPEAVAIVRQIFEWSLEGLGQLTIANRLNERGVPTKHGGKWHQGTVREILRNPAYAGHTAWNRTRQGLHHQWQDGKAVLRPREEKTKPRVKPGERQGPQVRRNDPADWVVVENTHEPLIDPATFEEVQRRMADRNYRPKQTGRPKYATYALAGLVYCEACGSKMHGTRTTKKKNGKVYEKRKYICSGYQCHGKSVCDHNAMSADELELQIAEVLADLARDPERREDLEARIRIAAQEEVSRQKKTVVGDDAPARLAKLDAQIQQCKKRIATADEDTLDALLERLRALKREHADLAKRDRASESPAPDFNVEQLVAEAMRVPDSLVEDVEQAAEAGVEALQALFYKTVERVTVRFETIQQKRRSVQVCAGGKLELKKVPETKMAGTRCNVDLTKRAA